LRPELKCDERFEVGPQLLLWRARFDRLSQ